MWAYFVCLTLLCSPTAHGSYGNDLIGLQDWQSKILDSIESTITHYLNENDEVINANLMLGVSIMKGQLMSCVNKPARSRKSFELMKRWYAINKVTNKLYEKFYRTNITEPKITKKILDPELWTSSKEIIHSTHHLPINEADMDSSVVEDLFFQNVSDTCILELLTSCRPSAKCIRSELEDNFLGYALTHQVLYIHILKKMNCIKSSVHIILDGFTQDKCNTMFNEAMYIVGDSNVFNDYKDLFIEQIAVCGMENMVDFIRPEWLLVLMSLQNQQGCFQSGDDNQSCDLHLAGVSLAALGVYWKFVCFKNNKIINKG
ncbi:UPF0764 protein C16orf89 homolog [Adelges cooleyi]|uniref:UPF0764 protein C16orf89 homolog n=1 Tax=Adelges cooleyi TaxID=133065 RepID=UPI0021801C97|nr:UPF0764 protein C16orf89 homolog [Adelges cooleyi]